MVRLISFDIDGTLEVGAPPGVIPMSVLRRASELGFLIGTCSDRLLLEQQRVWEGSGVAPHFTVVKQGLAVVRATFDAEHYLHIGDTEVDAMVAREAGFDFLHSLEDDVLAYLRALQLHP
ncbi:MAG: hypothetical protein EXR65_04755 [Dehalococcoidia bacterium]|nr:hypothetical protein [Dehalococcoidia bacterium]